MFALSLPPSPSHPVYALSLRHPGDGLRVPDSPVMDLGGDLTLEAWIRPRTADNGGSFHFIVSKNYGGAGYALALIGVGDKVRLQFEARDTLPYFIPMKTLAGHWWHVACVFRARQDMKMYLNGVMVAEKSTSMAMQPNNLPLYIGTSPWDSFSGDIADVRIWSVARTQEQVLDEMNTAASPKAVGLVAEWTFRTSPRGRSNDATHHTPPAVVLGKPVRRRISYLRFG